MWHYDPGHPHPRSPQNKADLPIYEREIGPRSMEQSKDNGENRASVKHLENILRDVERALSNIKQTLGELNRELKRFE